MPGDEQAHRARATRRRDGASAHHARGWARPAASVAALALTLTTCAVAMAAVGTDDAQVPDTGKAAAGAGPAPAAADVRRAKAVRERRVLRRPSDRLSWPIHGAISGGFDEQRAGHVHVGVDIPAPAGSPIRAASAGHVTLRRFEQGYGKYTCIAHRTITTCYGHQSRFGTTLGARVRRGQVIGRVGNTGDTSAYHLHFEVRRGARPWGTPVDPVRHLPRRQGAR